jgi:hypothetical protein
VLRFLAAEARPDVPEKRTLDQHAACLDVCGRGPAAL